MQKHLILLLKLTKSGSLVKLIYLRSFTCSEQVVTIRTQQKTVFIRGFSTNQQRPIRLLTWKGTTKLFVDQIVPKRIGYLTWSVHTLSYFHHGSNDEASLCLIYCEPDTCRKPKKVGVQVQFKRQCRVTKQNRTLWIKLNTTG